MKVSDWRHADVDQMRALYEDERRQWWDGLGWDTTESWKEVEEARASWRLPGALVLSDGGDVLGWTFFLIEHGTAHIGGLTSDTVDTTRALIDAVMARASRCNAEAVACFTLDRAPGLSTELVARGFDHDSYRYLSRAADTAVTSSGVSVAERWRTEDVLPAAALLQVAYGDRGRHFAAHGEATEWLRYVRNLVDYPGCGRFDAASSRVLRDRDRLSGVVMMTTLGDGVAHVAQVAVHPEARRNGVAGRLLDDALAAAALHGRPRVTLLVEEGNTIAGKLYADRGFTQCATFVAARRQCPPAS